MSVYDVFVDLCVVSSFDGSRHVHSRHVFSGTLHSGELHSGARHSRQSLYESALGIFLPLAFKLYNLKSLCGSKSEVAVTAARRPPPAPHGGGCGARGDGRAGCRAILANRYRPERAEAEIIDAKDGSTVVEDRVDAFSFTRRSRVTSLGRSSADAVETSALATV